MSIQLAFNASSKFTKKNAQRQYFIQNLHLKLYTKWSRIEHTHESLDKTIISKKHLLYIFVLQNRF